MAIIRAVTENRVEQRPYTDARVRAADFNGGEIIARAVQGAGREMQDTAQVMHQIELRDAETRARDADIQMQRQRLEVLSTGENAYFNLQGKAALNALPDVRSRLDEIDREGEELLKKDPHALRMFKDANARRRLAEEERIGVHAGKARLEYEEQTFTQSLSLSIDSAAAAADDPAEITRNFATIKGLVEQRAVRKGLAAPGTPEMDLLQRKVMSGAVSAVADRIRLKSSAEAQAFIMAHAKEVDSIELTKMLGAVDDEAAAERVDSEIDGFLVFTSTEAQMADPSLGAATGTTNAVQTALPAMEVQLAAIGGVESGNRERDAGGNLITSSAGAQGKMQVMPGTNTDPGYGVTPARDNSDAERTRVGRDYYKAMLKEYGGNATLALTAYNWGPGNVDAHIRKVGDPRKGQISDAAFINSLPADKNGMPRAYAPKVLSRMGAAPGHAGTPEAQSPTYAGEEINLAATINKIDASDRTFVEKQALKAAAKERYSLGRQARNDAESRVQDAALTAMLALGDNYTSYDQLPLSVRQQATPQLQASLRQAAETNKAAKQREAEGRAQDLAEQNPFYWDMKEAYNGTPEERALLLQHDFRSRGDLTFQQRSELLAMRGTVERERNADRERASEMRFSRGRTRATVGRFAGRDAGISNSSRASETERRNRILLEERVNLRAERWIADNKKQIPDAELERITREELTPVVVVQSGGFFGGTDEVEMPAYRVKGMPAGTKIRVILPKSVPAPEARKIAQDYARVNNGAVPDPEMIERIYRQAGQ